MKRLLTIVLPLLYSQIIFSQNSECVCEFENFFDFAISTYVNSEKQNHKSNLFYMINELEVDTINCVLKLNLSSDYDHNLLKKFNNHLFYKLNNDLIVLANPSLVDYTYINVYLDTLTIEDIYRFEDDFSSQKTNLNTSDSDFGTTVEYSNKRIVSWEGNYWPVMIFTGFKFTPCDDP